MASSLVLKSEPTESYRLTSVIVSCKSSSILAIFPAIAHL